MLMRKDTKKWTKEELESLFTEINNPHPDISRINDTIQGKDKTSLSNLLFYHFKANKLHLDVIKCLLSHGANPNDNYLLQKLCIESCQLKSNINLKAAELLLQYGADPNAKAFHDSNNQLLHIICREKSPNILLARLLIQFGANVNTPGQEGKTPLLLACSQPDIELDLVELLLKNKANPNTPCWVKKTCLDYGFEAAANNHGNLDTLYLLIKYNAKAERLKRSDLIYTVCRQDKPNLQLISLMLAHGAYQGAKTFSLSLEPFTPQISCLRIALEKNQYSLALLLLLKGADIADIKYIPYGDKPIEKLIVKLEKLDKQAQQLLLLEIQKNILMPYRMESSLGNWLMAMNRLKAKNKFFPIPPKFVKKKIAQEAEFLHDVSVPLTNYTNETCNNLIRTVLEKGKQSRCAIF